MNLSPFTDIQELDRIDLPIRSRYGQMYRVLVACLNDKTRELSIEFSGAFARLDYLCRELRYRQEHLQAYLQLCAFRGRNTHLKQYSDQQLQSHYATDVRALCEWLSVLYQTPVPESLLPYLSVEYPEFKTREWISDSIRCTVAETDAAEIRLNSTEGETYHLPWQYVIQGIRSIDLTYLRPMLKPGSQVNLVHPVVAGEMIYAELVIYEPDLLIDISTIAHSFHSCGTTAYHYLLKLIDTKPMSSDQLLGNLAGQMLDEEVHSLGKEEVMSYNSSLVNFFENNALQVVTCNDFLMPELQRKFHDRARLQQQNLRHLVQQTFREDRTIDLNKVVLEPSFYCEMLGLQGRMDLLQSDKHVLMEQKSGKMDEYHHIHKQEHYVQVLLYQAMLHYAYRDQAGKELRNDDIASYLLYSLYPNGLMKEAPAPNLLEEALRVRNQIAFLQLLLSRGEAEHIYSHLKPETFNVSHVTNRLWTEYTYPAIDQTLRLLQKAHPLSQAYFYRMFSFIAREHILSKMGTSQKEASGFAALWNSTSAEKREAGDLLDSLVIREVSEDNAHITLTIGNEDEVILPNFRIGDIVVLYSYPADQDPDARRDIVFRANLVEISSDTIVVRLTAPQKNQELFHTEGNVYWAVEHDFRESSYNGLYRGLYTFMEANVDRRSLLLGQRPPRRNEALTLCGDYGTFNELVLKAKQAEDYFLLVGPPGTGKTSCGLVNILNETIADSAGHNILLVSYTNRAVDEICSKLRQMGLPFLRISSEVSCPKEYHDNLLSVRCQQCHTAQEIRNVIQNCRVIVGTTTSVSSGSALFTLKQFDLCIIDEASQILEPHLLTLLTSRHGEENAIRKFIMIGDHKQLPAVVQQSEHESEVTDSRLHEIGLFNCRQSLFERLIRLNTQKGATSEAGEESPFIYTLCAQGRMHHEIAAFANVAFYANRLREVPLEHQERPIPYHTQRTDVLSQMLTTRRVSFMDVRKERSAAITSDKVNPQEAERIAEIIHAVWLLWEENGLTFDASQSVGVIVPYRHQISTIRKALESFGIPDLLDISIDTVERYQGSQRDVIIYGFTVSRPYQLDFLTNNCFLEQGQVIDRKLNVALTRAREIMILLGDEPLLRQNALFAQLIDSCVKQKYKSKIN